jgi:hypothetical protein
VGTGGFCPLQVCMVATLITGAAGRRNRGRMYLPANGIGFGSHEFPNARVDAVCQALAAWLDALNTLDGSAVVVSQAGTSKRAITQVRVDSKPDIQRRRANAQVASHTHTATL